MTDRFDHLLEVSRRDAAAAQRRERRVEADLARTETTLESVATSLCQYDRQVTVQVAGTEVTGLIRGWNHQCAVIEIVKPRGRCVVQWNAIEALSVANQSEVSGEATRSVSLSETIDMVALIEEWIPEQHAAVAALRSGRVISGRLTGVSVSLLVISSGNDTHYLPVQSVVALTVSSL